MNLDDYGTPISYDPGIPGFVKAHRHPAGPYLVMTTWTLCDVDWVGMFWVKRLIHNARRYQPQYFRLLTEQTIATGERHYQYWFMSGPPLNAYRDEQRQRVYDWEDEIICPVDNKPMPWSGCILFTKYVWGKVGDGKPLHLTNEGRAKTALSCDGSIYLPENDNDYHIKPVILHEIAHELTKFGAHGPGFVSTYMDLCSRFLGIDRRTLQVGARRYGVRYLT